MYFILFYFICSSISETSLSKRARLPQEIIIPNTFDQLPFCTQGLSST